ncbi:MAG: hypothetical protein OXF79_04720 [Chloroflexi bacterium]|nr:hypothetical protein [Chloroflexota bacterium]
MTESIIRIEDHYRQMVEEAEAYRYHIDSLTLSARRHLGNSVHKPMKPAAYCRHAATPGLPSQQPLRSGQHWTTHYLEAITAATANWEQCHQALTELCQQGADEHGNLSPPTVAMFAAAVGALLAKHPAPQPDEMAMAEARERRAFLSLAAGIARTYRPHAINQERLRQLLRSALTTAVAEASAYTAALPVDFEEVRSICDQHGVMRQQTAPHAALSQANQLANCALTLQATPVEHPALRTLQALKASHGDAWKRHSAAACAHDIIPQQLHHNTPGNPKLSPENLAAISEVANSTLSQAKAVHAIYPMTDHLQMIIVRPASETIDAERQQEMAQSLITTLQKSSHWHTQPPHFAGKPDPGSADFHLLDQSYSTLLLHHGRILAVALRLDAPELTARRDAILATAAGALNRRAREEHAAYRQHPIDDDRHDQNAQRRLELAASIVAAMPDSVVDPQERDAIAKRDARGAATNPRGNEPRQPPSEVSR